MVVAGVIAASSVPLQPGRGASAAAAAPAPPAAPHVMVIVEENQEYGNVIGAPAAPYLNSLAAQHTLVTHWFAVQHNSPADYLALISGNTWGIGTPNQASFPLPPSDQTLVDELAHSGFTWKAYMEGMPSPCYTGSSTVSYSKIHNPFMSFSSIIDSPDQCNRVVPYSPSQMSSDLNSGSPPDFVWITPDDCDNMHGNTASGSPCATASPTQLISAGDTWLQNNLPTVLSSSWFAAGGTVIVTWDEGTSSAGWNGGDGGHIPTLVINSAGARHLDAGGDHYGTLKGIEEVYGVGQLGGSAGASDGDLSQAFAPGQVDGQVTDAQTGAAVAGASVTCTCNPGGTVTDAGGRYTLADVPPATGYRVTFSAGGYATQTVEGVAVSPGTGTTVNVQLTAPGSIAGTVTDALTGGAVAGAIVSCTCAPSGVTTGAAGGYSFDGLLAGTYTLSVSSPGYQDASAAGVVAAAGTTVTQDFQLASARLLTVSPGAGPPGGGTPVTITGSGFQPGAAVTFGATPATGVQVSSATALSATSPPGTGLVGITVTNPDGTSVTLPDGFTYTSNPACVAGGATAPPGAADTSRPWDGGSVARGAGAAATNAYFAEGYTGRDFHEYLAVENAGPAQPLCVDYLLQSGAVVTRVHQLPARSRTTIDVNQEVGAGQNVSAHLYAPNPFVAERPMYFDFRGSVRGGDDVVGAQSLGTDYYFAEGYTGPGFDEYLSLLNPDPVQAAHVDILYYFGDGSTKSVGWTIPAHSRSTVHVNDPSQAGPNQQVSAEVRSLDGVPFLAERPIYFDYRGKWTGGDVVVGGTQLSKSLNLAEGYVSSGFDEWLTILNTNPSDAHLIVTYEVQGGPPKMVRLTVPAHSRGSHLVNQDFSAATSLAVHIDSDQPVMVERPMYFDYNGRWDGGHDAAAAADSELGTTYNFAEGYVAPNFAEYVTLVDPTSTPAAVTITYLLAGGGTKQVTLQVPANGRATRFVNADFPGQTVEQSLQVTSTNGVPILAERPMYFAY